MSNSGARFKVGDQVRIVHGREVGESGTIVMIHEHRPGVLQFIVEYGNGRRAYCAAYDLILEKP